MKETIINIKELKQDDLNFNLGSEVGKELLEKSFRELGAGRSVLVDKDNRLIGGNKAQQAAIAAGIKKVRVIDTDGTELVAVRRTDVTLDSKQGRDLALADNSTAAANLRWDEDAIKAAQEQWSVDAEDWGVKIMSEIDMDSFFEEGVTSNKKDEKIVITIPVDYNRDDVLVCVEELVKEFPKVQVK